MSKSSIATFLLAIASAVAVAYFMGVFDSNTPSVSVSKNGGGQGQMRSAPVNRVATASPETTTSVAPTTTVKEAPQPQETTPATKAPTLTKAEVAKHATKSNCWVIIDGNVYDLTPYIVQHPGGQGVIIQECGRDGTTAFTEVRKHLRTNVQAELTYYLLGKLM
ncbi:MAG: cytochrome b5 domain-containing protein [Candidatus Pacebacteria bacterium]|jgi:cytochrome b involved in lipid metabolism|nr:cytochrome b5 domain-containing protein [Candidatus Paceibacterota bacterium]